MTTGFRIFWGLLIFTLCPASFYGQVSSEIDTTSIKIGEEILYKIQVETDTTDLVIFPEGQTFIPLEVIESYDIDTTLSGKTFTLIKRYGLTQFDSGRYTIPPQKILIGDKIFNTDSLRVEVNPVKVDTTEQGLYDIKPIIEVNAPSSNWWLYLLIVLVLIGLAAFAIYWFVWRKKPLTEEEEIALLPPYDRAKLALKKLDESHYLEREELKEYYSELTLAIRRYLDEQVYDHSLESTTDQLILRLQLLKEGNQIDLSPATIKNIESILRRADLVKFARSKPDLELARMDRNIVDQEIDHVKEALPEPTEEQKLQDEKYRKDRERREKRRKIVITVAAVLFLAIFTYAGFGAKYGFGYVTDKIFGDDTLELLEGEWVRSAYGVPPVYISTPEVLERVDIKGLDTISQANKTVFVYGNLREPLYIYVATNTIPQERASTGGSNQMDLNAYTEQRLRYLEDNGVTNIITKAEKFTTPNAQEGIKVFGNATLPTKGEEGVEGEYVILAFSAENVIQEILLTWQSEEDYADEIMEKIIGSIELKIPQE
ncbi:MAG: BatD family protein [Flavobacteriaceae bacterium]|nr:BatD family protein [Flavobacteriaceae bacterium]